MMFSLRIFSSKTCTPFTFLPCVLDAASHLMISNLTILTLFGDLLIMKVLILLINPVQFILPPFYVQMST